MRSHFSSIYILYWITVSGEVDREVIDIEKCWSSLSFFRASRYFMPHMYLAYPIRLFFCDDEKLIFKKLLKGSEIQTFWPLTFTSFPKLNDMSNGSTSSILSYLDFNTTMLWYINGVYRNKNGYKYEISNYRRMIALAKKARVSKYKERRH